MDSMRESLLVGDNPAIFVRDLAPPSPASRSARCRLGCAGCAHALCTPGAFLAFCFCCCGVGVALPWTALRMGVAYLTQEYSSAVYPRLFCLYYATQAAVLLLQCRLDRALDLVYGASLTFTLRITTSVAVLVALLLAFPLAAASEAALYGLTACVGVFDACAFGSCAQLFSSIKTTNASGFYFLGTSLSSLLAIGLSEATGFTALSSSGGGGGASGGRAIAALPLAFWAFYASCAAVTLGALVAVTALLYSQQGAGYLATIDEALLASAPTSPRAMQRVASGGSLASTDRRSSPSPASDAPAAGGGSGTVEMVELSPAAAAAAAARASSAAAAAAAAAELRLLEERQWQQAREREWEQEEAEEAQERRLLQRLQLSPLRERGGAAPGAAAAAAQAAPDELQQQQQAEALTSSWELFVATLRPQLAIFFLWGSTSAVDSLISYYPSQAQTAAAGAADGGFTVTLLYASLAGELCGKLGFLACGARRVYEAEGEEGGGAEEALGGATTGKGKRSGGASAAALRRARRRRPYTTIPCISSTRLLLGLSLLRSLAVAPFFLLLLQQLWGPERGGGLLRGWFYSDAAALAAQFLFDMLGSFLSSLTYTLIPFIIALSDRSQASSILSFTLTVGTFVGLGGSLLASSFLPQSST